jgi:hypothetical protein
MMSLWSIIRSPLMMGGDLPSSDDYAISLLSNPEVIEVDQRSRNNRHAYASGDFVTWLADSADGKDTYLAVFNVGERKKSLRLAWKELGLSGSCFAQRDLWARADLGQAKALKVSLAPHQSALYRLSPRG